MIARKATAGTAGIVISAGYAYQGVVVDDHRPVKVLVRWTLKSGRIREAWRYAYWTDLGFVFHAYRVRGEGIEKTVEQRLPEKTVEILRAAVKLDELGRSRREEDFDDVTGNLKPNLDGP